MAHIFHVYLYTELNNNAQKIFSCQPLSYTHVNYKIYNKKSHTKTHMQQSALKTNKKHITADKCINVCIHAYKIIHKNTKITHKIENIHASGGSQNKQAPPKMTSAKDLKKDDDDDRQTGSNTGNSNSKGKTHHATMRLGDLLLANLRSSKAAQPVAMPVPYTLKMRPDEKRSTCASHVCMYLYV